ncbi:helix-turn-helix domain-containing protein [Bradyrhizobium elkanii]|uniref:helix-turn-helix domain-containing protein n=1 Tax=Bradyrhizobium elkanii TaxID=29448 RepID=UPI002714F642|nr:helix-turn-helix transcriptional regulator [Bradyrhizobium elkanii]WLA50723.1 helix-turn-helix transcriptional regulator [Bradyrhizobium elkanii]WLB79039.1 helix-turn-helix transcriptional regulator [Bradyrhizobium elkanii]
MAETPNRIADWRRRRKLTQQQLADLVGAHWITISKLERGLLPLTSEWVDKIAEALKVVGVQLHANDRKEILWIDTVILDGEMKGTSHGPESEEDPLPLEIVSKSLGIWALVADDSLYPAFQKGDMIKLTVVLNLPDSEPGDRHEDFVGRLCLIRPKDIDRRVVAVLEKANKANKFTARPLNGPPLKDITVEILAPIEQAIFQPQLTEELRRELK